MNKTILFNNEAREKILNGVNTLADAVSITFGPKGNNVMYEQKFKSPMITNDGISIAKEIKLKDPIENMGAKVVCEAASKTNSTAGDGTTGATILARSIIKNGFEQIMTKGANAILLREGMRDALADINTTLDKLSKEIDNNDEVKRIATISSQDDYVGSMIADAIKEVGKEGIITVEESKSVKTTLVISEGMEVDTAFVSPYFIENQKTVETEMEDCYILITDKTVGFNEQILPILEMVFSNESKYKSIVIIAEEFEGEALQTTVVNKLRNKLDIAVVKSTEYGETKRDSLEDLATLVGTTLIDEESGIELSELTLDHLGFAKKFIIKKEKSTIVSGFGDIDIINQRIAEIKDRIENEEDDDEKEILKNRLAKLTGGVAIIRLGAQTEQELKEKYLRLEDALNATKSALEEGIVPGGGSTLLIVSEILREKKKTNVVEDKNWEREIGYSIVLDALEEPLRQLAKNAGMDEEIILSSTKKVNSHVFLFQGDKKHITNVFGYDAMKNNFVDMLDSGIIDPTKVIRSAINNAVSIASTLLTTQVTICEEE